MILLEKAWAKINGGYNNIAAGLTREALRSLTGASCQTFFTSQKRDELWEALLEGERKNYIMTACSDDLNNNGSDACVEKIGICGSHAYSLLEAFELVKGRNGKYKLRKENENISRS